MGSLQKNGNHSKQTMLSPFLSIQKEFDKAMHGFYDMFSAKPFQLAHFDNLAFAPLMDLVEEASCYKLEVEMPGMDEKDIHVAINDNLLTIKGEKSCSSKSRKNYIAREISYGHYERSITLPVAADGNHASANFKKGLLCITIPKKAGSRGHKQHEISIKKG